MPFSQEELVERRNYLGGSEAAAAIGLSDWYTPYQLWLSKKGKGEPIEETLPMMVGTALEDTVLRLFEKENELGLTVTDRQAVVKDVTWPIRRATLDGVASDGGIIQAKCSGLWKEWGKADDAVPQYVIYQTHHEMACSGAQHAWVPVIMAQREFRIYRVDRDNELIEMLKEGEKNFWKHVTDNKTPPALSNDDIKIMYPFDVGVELVAGFELAKTARELATVKNNIKALEAHEEKLAIALKAGIGSAATLLDPDTGKPMFTYKAHQCSNFDKKTFTKEHPDLAAKYTSESTVRTLLFKI